MRPVKETFDLVDDDGSGPDVDPRQITRPHDSLLTYYLIVSLATTAAFPFVFVPLFIRYKTLRSRFDNPKQIRDLILERVRWSKSAGLGDEPPEPAADAEWSAGHVRVLKEILAEVKRVD